MPFARSLTMLDLRELAEARLRRLPAARERNHDELELHKLELELQNEELRRAQDALERTRDRYRELFDAAPVAYLTLDRAGRIAAANRAACELACVSHDQLVGSALAALLRSDDADHLYRCLHALRDGERRRIDVDLLLPDEPARPIVIDATCGGSSYLVVLTARGAEKAALHHQTRQIAAFGASASTIAHEVNNLLQIVVAALDDVAATAGPPAQDSVRCGQRTLAHCKELVSRLLSVGLPQAPNPLPIVVDDFIARTLELLRPLVGKHIEVHAELGAPGARVAIDPVELELVLINLAANAHDAMPTEGRLEISTCVVTRTRQVRSLVIHVADTGTGMSEATRERIFEPFFTTKASRGGTGLGLATSLGIVRRARGTIDVRSVAGAGTTFEITLPVYAPHQPRFALGTEKRPRLEIAAERKSILVVDDNFAARTAMAAHLETLGHRVITADTATTALALARSEILDVALLDYRLRTMSGDVLARHLRELHPTLGVLLTSGYPRDCITTTERFLQKPFSLDELTAAITAVLARA